MRLTRNINDEGAAEENSWLVDTVMLVATSPKLSMPLPQCEVDRSPQSADAASFQQEGRPAMEGLARPALRKSPEDMAVGNN